MKRLKFKGNGIAWAIGALAAAIAVVGVVIWKSSKDTATKFQASVDQASQSTSGINALAGTINGFLTGKNS